MGRVRKEASPKDAAALQVAIAELHRDEEVSLGDAVRRRNELYDKYVCANRLLTNARGDERAVRRTLETTRYVLLRGSLCGRI